MTAYTPCRTCDHADHMHPAGGPCVAVSISGPPSLMGKPVGDGYDHIGRPYQIHHRRPRGMGGSSRDDTNTPANALFVCCECHKDIEANRDDALAYGWLLRQGQDPVAERVLRRGQWVTLANDGWMH